MGLPDIFPQLTSFTVLFGPARTDLLRKHLQSGQETRWSPLTRVSSARQAVHYSSARLGGEQPGHRQYLSCPCLFLRLSIHSYSPQYPSCPLGELSLLPTHPKLHHVPQGHACVMSTQHMGQIILSSQIILQCIRCAVYKSSNTSISVR